MEALILLLIGLAITIVVAPFVAIAKANKARRTSEALAARVAALETELRKLRPEAAPRVEPQPIAPAPATAPRAPSVPPPLPVVVAPQPAARQPEPRPSDATIAGPKPATATPPVPHKPPINWEQFMGAKLFAWIGGLALFLGVAFFVKYSFEHNLIPAAVRVAIGFVVGAALLVGGVLLKRKENAVTAQTLCATGVLVLYAVTFACRSYYHFPFFGLIPTFLLMVLITAVAFVLAVRLNAIVVAILGIAGGFLTPVLLSTGQDRPLGLFVYIALLDIGLLAVAQRQRWKILPSLGAIGTIAMQIGWIATFFVPEKYFAGTKVLGAMAVFLAFQALFLAGVNAAKRANRSGRELLVCAIGLGVVAIGFAFYLLSFATISERPVLLFSYLFLADLGLLALAWLEERIAIAEAFAGWTAFLFLGVWTGNYVTNANLYSALAFYFVFALFHTVAPLLRQRLRKDQVPWWSHGFPSLALLLVLMPLFQLTHLSILVWPFVLLLDALAIVLAIMSASLLPLIAVLLLTFAAIGAWLMRIPTDLTGLPTTLSLLTGFAIFFFAAASWMVRRYARDTAAAPNFLGKIGVPASLPAQLAALSAVMPFLLLIMATLRLPLPNPSPVFGVALLFVVLLLGMSEIFSLDLLPAIALVSVLALEHTWHFQHFNAAHAALPLIWYLGFYLVFTVYPFLFHRKLAPTRLPWAAAALAGPLHFYLIYQLIRTAYPSGVPGLIPAVLALPSLLGLFVLLKRTPVAVSARNAQLALFGGAALFFITLIFPIQFDRQWITVGWALEGVALCWLFHRVPHPGLRLTGVALLLVVFARLALNPAVLSYHARAAFPILNWYLYTYGIGAVAFFGAARLLAPPRHLVLQINVRPLLYALGTVLAFLLVNIEIADYFSRPGSAALTFQFSGNFARDMSYSIAWALFALVLLIVGIRQRTAAVRYASLGLLGVTIVKLFLHDLSQLDQLYRIAAFIVVAVIAILASFLYQRFLGSTENNEAKSPAS